MTFRRQGPLAVGPAPKSRQVSTRIVESGQASTRIVKSGQVSSRIVKSGQVITSAVNFWHRASKYAFNSIKHMCRLYDHRCRAKVARVRQSRPDFGPDFEVKVLNTLSLVPSWLGSGCGKPCGRGAITRGQLTIQGSGFRVQGSGCRDQGSGIRVQGLGFRVEGVAVRV